MLTNGGGILEVDRAKVVNRVMFDQNETFEPRLEGKQMILCHTPLKTLAPQFHDKYVLISGYGDLINVAINHGFKKPLLCEELFALMPALSPLNTKLFSESHLEMLSLAALKRFGKDTKAELLNDL